VRRAVLFDLYNTLVPGGSFRQRWSVGLAMGRVLGVDPDAYARAFHESWPDRFVGRLGDLTASVRLIATRVGGSPSDQQVARAAALRQRMYRDLVASVSADTLAVLDKLRADGWSLGLVSNTSAETPGRVRAGPLAARLDATGFSNELGVRKPDPRIYLAVCDSLGVAPEQCGYVGDGDDGELGTAAALGMRAVRTVEHADTDPSWRGPTVGHLAALPPLLGAPS
jgi:putative hydrolase of the HAD superfamily